MALVTNALKFNVSISMTNGLLKFAFAPGTTQHDNTVDVIMDQVVTVGTSEEVLAVPADITTHGMMIFQNLDATNFVQIGKEVTGAMEASMKILAGDWPCIIAAEPGITWRAQADTANVNIRHIVIGR